MNYSHEFQNLIRFKLMSKKLLLTFSLLMTICFVSWAQPNPNNMFISGYVYNTNGNAVNNWTVCVYADTTLNSNFYYYQCVTTNSNGYYSFDITDGSVTGPNVTYHVYTYDCQQNLVDTVLINGQGSIDHASHDFTICANNNSQCDASFSWTNSTPTGGTPAVIYFSYDGPLLNTNTYSWSFGDGSGDNIPDPIHTFTSTGPYYVCLTVSNSQTGCTATHCDTITFNNQTCQGYFSYSSTVFNPFNVAFSGGANGNVTSWFWDFGDGHYSQVQNPNHVYQDSGIYVVCLTINNCNSAYCDTVVVGGNGNNTGNCSANFTWSPISNPNGGTGFQFTYQGTTSNPNTYHWDFGDGTTSTVANPSHYYSVGSGPFPVCLVVSNGNCTATHCDTVGNNNSGNCQADFIAIDSAGTFFFLDYSLGSNSYWLWDFGDGHSSNLQYPHHQYANPGTYTVCLTVGNNINTCSDTYCSTVVVDSTNNNPCQVSFQYYTTPNGVVVFQAYGGNNTSSYTWSFGNGSGGTGQTVTAQLPSGTHQVCVTISDPATGCQSTSCQTIVIGGNNTNTYCISGTVSLGTPNLPADMAIVYLITYDSQTNLLVAVQATTVDSSGHYGFCQVPAGQYLVKAALTPNSSYYLNFVPTYYGNSLFWNYAAQVNVSANVSNVDIWLIAGANNGGPGFIGGDVTQGANKTSGPGDPLAEVQIMLLDMNNYPIAYLYSDAQGHFEFPNLAYGTYQVWAEITGLTTIPAIVTISANEPSIDNITIIVNDTEITTGIRSLVEAAKLNFGNVYPNPSNANMFMQVSSEAALQLTFSTFDLAGRMVDSRIVTIPSGKTQVDLQTTELNTGIYTLYIQSEDGSLSVSKKLVKTE